VRRVFFSFHYERDVQRASIVRNSWVTKPNTEDAGFIDAASWEAVKKKGEAAVREWIKRQLDGTSVTVVLIGPETSSRAWVREELRMSYDRGNGFVGIYLHNIKDFNGNTDRAGDSYFGELGKRLNGGPVYFFEIANNYDWILDNGYSNLGNWVEEAAKRAGR